MRPRHTLLALPLCAAACVDRPVTEVAPTPENIGNLVFDADPNPNLDLLFVIDNSRSMFNEQQQVTTNFPRMIEVLEQLPAGLPNLHLGVISTDVGAGGACNPPGTPPGVLRNTPMVAGCAPPADRWISDVDDGTETGTRIRNYTASLSDTFSCIASLGTTGCGYEQPLESLRQALDPSTLENTGFLRDGSLLAVVILSDEDDCSAFDPSFFDDPTPEGIDGDWRCFEQGVTCDGPPDQLGSRENCTARDDSPYISPVTDFVEALREVRPQSNRLVVAGILGDASPVTVGLNAMDDLDVLVSCQPDAGNPEGAYPPIRTDSFLAQFPGAIRTRICNADLTPAIEDIGAHIVENLYGGCIHGELASRDTPECSVTETRDDGSEDILPRCDNDDGEAATNQPCWTIDVDPLCTLSDDHLRITTHFPTGSTGGLIHAQCRLVPGEPV